MAEIFRSIAAEFQISPFEFETTANTVAFKIELDDKSTEQSRLDLGDFKTGQRSDGSASLGA